jgi:hypothetical protein
MPMLILVILVRLLTDIVKVGWRYCMEAGPAWELPFLEVESDS